MNNPPVDFEERAKRPNGATGSDYPYAIKASDLMQNFVYATLNLADGLYEEATGIGGHSQRKLKIRPGSGKNQILCWDGAEYIPLPSAPTDRTYVLGARGGQIQWIATEECT